MNASIQTDSNSEFFRIAAIVKQWPEKQQQQLINMIDKKEEIIEQKKALTDKKQAFLRGLNKSVSFINNYKSNDKASVSFEKMIDEL